MAVRRMFRGRKIDFTAVLSDEWLVTSDREDLSSFKGRARVGMGPRMRGVTPSPSCPPLEGAGTVRYHWSLVTRHCVARALVTLPHPNPPDPLPHDPPPEQQHAHHEDHAHDHG